MRKDQLLVTTQGVRGGKSHSNLQGSVRATVLKGFNEPEDSIEIEIPPKHGERESALMNITFKSGKQFNGTFEELERKLNLNTLLLDALKDLVDLSKDPYQGTATHKNAKEIIRQATKN